MSFTLPRVNNLVFFTRIVNSISDIFTVVYWTPSLVSSFSITRQWLFPTLSLSLSLKILPISHNFIFYAYIVFLMNPYDLFVVYFLSFGSISFPKRYVFITSASDFIIDIYQLFMQLQSMKINSFNINK